MSRTPPIKLPEPWMSAICGLSPVAMASIFRIGFAHYETGKFPSFDQAREIAGLTVETWSEVATQIRPFLDADRLTVGQVAVAAFSEARSQRDKIRASRSKAAVHRYQEAASRLTEAGNTVKLTKGRQPKKAQSRSTHVHMDAHMYTPDAHMCISESEYRPLDDMHTCASEGTLVHNDESTLVHRAGRHPENEGFYLVATDRDPAIAHGRRAEFSDSDSSVYSEEKNPSARIEENVQINPRQTPQSQSVASPNQPERTFPIENWGGASSASREERSARPGTEKTVQMLLERLANSGPVDPEFGRKAMARLLATYGPDEVRNALDAFPSRQIERPMAYLERILQNGRSAPRQEVAPVAEDTGRPKTIRRFVRRPHNARWEMEGWAARGEGPQDGTRRQVWRTDAGGVSFQRPDHGESIPSYESDPGVRIVD